MRRGGGGRKRGGEGIPRHNRPIQRCGGVPLVRVRRRLSFVPRRDAGIAPSVPPWASLLLVSTRGSGILLLLIAWEEGGGRREEDI